MGGRRCALIVATYEYDDDRLTALRSPEHDAEALIDVLGDPAVGGFEVTPVVNKAAHEVNLAVADFFDERRPDDLLLVHFSCHGVKDEDGELYLAARNTRLGRLDPTATSSTYLRREMDRTRAGSVVLLLDCCYAGAFSRGAGAKASAVVDLRDQLAGRGRAVIAASSAVQFSFEGDELTSVPGARRPSVFTGALVEGLRSGEADRDLDGRVSLDELYDYLLEEVRRRNPHQVPEKQMNVAGAVYVAHRALPPTRPSELPESVRRLMAAESPWERKAAVEPLGLLLAGDHPGLALAAQQALETLAEDPDERVPGDPRPGPVRRVLAATTASRSASTSPSAPCDVGTSRPGGRGVGLALVGAGFLLVRAVTSSPDEEPTADHPTQEVATAVDPLPKSLMVASHDEASDGPACSPSTCATGRRCRSSTAGSEPGLPLGRPAVGVVPGAGGRRVETVDRHRGRRDGGPAAAVRRGRRPVPVLGAGRLEPQR